MICSPEEYWSSENQTHIASRRESKDHRWIFDLLDGNHHRNEDVYEDHDEWMLCKNKHPGSDVRYLVVFKDRDLHTIRNLTQAHLPMLRQIRERCLLFLRSRHHQREWRMFFNYKPSVLQLHMHISRVTSFSSIRLQPLNCIMQNLSLSGTYYRDALIYSPPVDRKTKHHRRRQLESP